MQIMVGIQTENSIAVFFKQYGTALVEVGGFK